MQAAEYIPDMPKNHYECTNCIAEGRISPALHKKYQAYEKRSAA